MQGNSKKPRSQVSGSQRPTKPLIVLLEGTPVPGPSPLLVVNLLRLLLEWAVHLAADEADGRVPVPVHPAGAGRVTNVQHARGAALVYVAELIGHDTCVVAEVMDGGSLLELAGGPVLVEAAATVDLHGCLLDGGVVRCLLGCVDGAERFWEADG